MICVGIDLSLTATGISTAERTYVLDTPASKTKGMARLRFIMREVLDAATGADLVCIEEYAFSRGDAHAHELGELGGVVKMALFERRVPWVPVPLASLKKFGTAKGNAKKGEMLVAAERVGAPEMYGNDNAADAFWLRQIGLYASGESQLACTKYRDEAAAVIRLPQARQAV